MSIETFQLVRERCLLSNLNIRTEMHGDERERAVDLNFEFSGANNLLLKLHPELRHSFYRATETRDIDADHTPVLRFPLMGPISWDLEIPRTRLRLHAEDPANDVVLGDGKTNKFKLTLLDGGTVKWHFRCQFSKPDDAAIGGLAHFLNDTVPISLECAELEEKPDLFEQVEQQTKEPMSAARQEAESLFSQAGTDMVLDPAAAWPPKSPGPDTPQEEVEAGRAASLEPPEQVETESVSIVTPITKGRRGGRKVAGGANLE